MSREGEGRQGEARGRFHALVRLVIYLVAQIAALALVIGLGSAGKKALGVEQGTPGGLMASNVILLLSLLAVLGVTAMALRHLSRLPMSSLGLVRAGRWRAELLAGLGVGILCPVAVASVGLVLGLARFTFRKASPHLFGLALVKTLLISLFEETLFRGYFFQEVERYKGAWAAMGATFCIFGGLHMLNDGGSLQGLISTGLAGAALYYTFATTRRLWVAIGFHFTWNTTLSLVLGFSNGGEFFPGRLMDAVMTGPALVSGGSFGPEASVMAWASFISVALAARFLAREQG